MRTSIHKSWKVINGRLRVIQFTLSALLLGTLIACWQDNKILTAVSPAAVDGVNVPNVQEAASGQVRSERYYYDGIRRIQETVLDPSMSLMMALQSGSPQEQNLAEESLGNAQAAAADDAVIETGAAPMQLEASLLEVGTPVGGGVRLAREYVWGPGDSWGASPVDELLAYYAEGRMAWWPLQDAGGDVVAVCAPQGASEGYHQRVVAQQTYDAYGQVQSADHLLNHPFLAVGHKGLVYDRLDRGVSDSTARGASVPPNAGSNAAVETPKVVPFARGLYHVRNRGYMPGGGSPTSIGLESITPTGPPGNPWQSYSLSQAGLSSGAAVQGRWMQADPNATGINIIYQSQFHGISPTAKVNPFDLEAQYATSQSKYQYLESSTFASSDVFGLYTGEDAFEDLTDVMSIVDPLPGPSDFIRAVLSALVQDYSANLAGDVGWANNWDLSDEDHSRGDNTWVTMAIGRGLHEAFDIGLPGTDLSVNPLDIFASGSSKKISGAPHIRRIGVRAGHTIYTKIGQRAHAAYRLTLGGGYDFEFRVPGGRVDAIDIKNKVVREQKPATPSGRIQGEKQLLRYIEALRNHPDPKVRGEYTPLLDTYRPSP